MITGRTKLLTDTQHPHDRRTTDPGAMGPRPGERVLWIASARLLLIDTTVARTEAADLAGQALHVLAAGADFTERGW